jgi:DNA-binding transcriptional LysR family regulator
MDIQQLRVFRAAARLGGFTRAGEDLHLSQSTVSLHIKQLEEELGAELFLRTGKRVYLNEAGRTLLQYSDKIFNEIKNAEMAVHELSTLQRGTVRLGVGATTLIYLMPKILAAYQRKYPDIELVVTTGLSEALAQAVHAQTVDIAIVMLPVPPNLSIEIVPILREELVCVLSAQHPLAAKEILSPKDLDGARFIGFLQESSIQVQLDKYLAVMNAKPHITMELENIEAIKALVRGGLGMAVLPQSSVAGAQGSMLQVRRIRGFPMERQLGLALPKSGTLPLAIHKLAARIVKGISGKSISELR